MARTFTGALLVASAAAVSLTSKNFDAEVFDSGKTAFIKFQAPWCGHCKAMKPDWKSLEKKFADSEYVLIGDVDCTADDGKDVCSQHDVSGYPTLKYFKPGSKEGTPYDGGRSKKELVKFAKKFDPGNTCAAYAVDQCTEKQLAKLQPFLDMSKEDLLAQMAEITAEMDAAKAAKDAVQAKMDAFKAKPFGPAAAAEGKELRAELESVEKPLQELKRAKNPTLKLITAALATEPPPSKASEKAKDKDEV